MRFRDDDDEELGVDLSPLIDCVFLLLIFFLVTTMMKRTEQRLPVQLPDSTASLAAEPVEPDLVIGLDPHGNLYRQTGRDALGLPVYQPLGALDEFLATAARESGTERTLRIDADAATKFQGVIEVLDACKLAGFTSTGVRVRQPGDGSIHLPPPTTKP